MFAEPLLSTCVFLQLDMPFMPLGCVNVDSARRGAKDMTGVGKHTPAQPNISLFSPCEYPSHAKPRHATPGQQQKDPFDHGLGPKGISLDIAPSTSSSTQLLMPVPLASSSPFLICLPLVLPLFLLLPLHYGKL